MDIEKTVRDAYVDTVNSQLESGDPPEARATMDRLVAEGHSRNEAMQLMAAALRIEMGHMLSESKPFDNARYAALLRKLPAL